MKKTLFALVMLVAIITSASAQKKSGTIYGEHELIDKTRDLWQAFAANDKDTYLGFYADSVFLTSNGNPGRMASKDEFANNMKWWQSAFEDLKVYDQKPAYPDALDYKEGVDWVQDWTVISGVHSKTGIFLEMPVHRMYAFNEDGKIVMLVNYFENDIFQKINDAQTTTGNGDVYDNHPHIATTRKLVNAFRNGDAEAYMGFFDENARFAFSWKEFGETTSYEENKKNLAQMFANGYEAKIEETGYPDCIYYEKGNQFVVYSWWKHTREKDGKKYEFPIMLSHTYNDEGKIVMEYVYGSTNHFE